MKTIFYVGYYDKLKGNNRIRNYSLAAAKKMDFVAKTVRDLGFHVKIVSPAYITLKDCDRIPETTQEIDDKITLALTPSSGAKNKVQRIIRVLQSKVWLFSYLIKNTTKESHVIVYHNYEIANSVLLAQKIKHFKLLLEIEEQYNMVWNLKESQRRAENRLLKQGKRGSLVVSEVLAERLGVEDPIVSYGNYNVFTGEIPTNKGKETITLVYTGSIDKVKNSAYMALEVMPLLPERYILKLSGPIAKGEEKLFRNKVDEINRKCGRTVCEYLEVLGDQEYSGLLCSADIALNLQQEGEFGQFLFPSKIMTYLAYNLPVVTTMGDSIVKSQVAELLTFADGFDEASIAKAITSVNLDSDVDRREHLKHLSKVFERKLAAALK